MKVLGAPAAATVQVIKPGKPTSAPGIHNATPPESKESDSLLQPRSPASIVPDDTPQNTAAPSPWINLPSVSPPPYRVDEFPQFLDDPVLELLKERMDMERGLLEVWPHMPPVRAVHEMLAYDALINTKFLDFVAFRGNSRADDPALIRMFRDLAYEKDAAWRVWDRTRIAWIDFVRNERLAYWDRFDALKDIVETRADRVHEDRREFFQDRLERIQDTRDFREVLNNKLDDAYEMRHKIFWEMVEKNLEEHRRDIPYSARNIRDLLRWLPEVPNKFIVIQAIAAIEENRLTSVAEQIMDHANSRAVPNAVWFHDFSFIKQEKSQEAFQDYLRDLDRRDLTELKNIRKERDLAEIQKFMNFRDETLFDIKKYWEIWDHHNQPVQHSVSMFGSNRAAIHGLHETGNKTKVQYAMALNEQNLDFMHADQMYERQPQTNDGDILYHKEVFDSYTKMIKDRQQRRDDHYDLEFAADQHRYLLEKIAQETMINRKDTETHEINKDVQLDRQESFDRHRYYVDVLSSPWSGQNTFFSTRSQEQEERETESQIIFDSNLKTIDRNRETSALHATHDADHTAFHIGNKQATFDSIDDIARLRKEGEVVVSKESYNVEGDQRSYDSQNKIQVGFDTALHNYEAISSNLEDPATSVDSGFYFDTKTQAHAQNFSAFPTPGSDLNDFTKQISLSPVAPDGTQGIHVYANLEVQNQLVRNNPPPEPLFKASDESEVSRQKEVAQIRFYDTTSEYPDKPLRADGLLEKKKPFKPI